MGKDSDAGVRGAEEANILSQQGIDELRRQFGETQADVDPFIQAGIAQLPALQAGATPGGFGANLQAIFGSGALDPLVEERTRAAQGALASAGLTRSGTAIQELSAIPQELGLNIENLLFNRQAGLAGGGQSAALNLGQLGAQSAGNIANIFGQQGQNIFAGRTQDAQRQADLIGDIIGATGALGGGLARGVGTAGGAAAFFSDKALKENIEPVGEIGPLTLYQWDWIPETKDMLISKFPTLGFVADEVKQHFPEFVKEVCGFDAVDYKGLLDKIEGDLAIEGAG